MSILDSFATWMLNTARSIGRLLGRELVVEFSDHSIKLTMEKQRGSNRAWDNNLYKRGSVFYRGYANPLKITIDHKPEMGKKDTAEIEEADTDDTDTEDSNREADVITSDRYTQFMRNDLISQLLNPQEQWDKLLYGMIGIGALQFLTVIVTLWTTGSF